MPRIDRFAMERWVLSGSWTVLEERARTMISEAGLAPDPSPLLGGGTRLMIALRHRISRDIDLFIRDPQFIGYLSPRLNDRVGARIRGYEEDATFLKLVFEEGEIDIIVRMSLTGLPPEFSPQSLFALEPVEEVLAKKLFYRGDFLKPRDLFDWYCIETMRPELVDPKRISRIVATRMDGIFQSLERMGAAPSDRTVWNLIDTPMAVDFDAAVAWGKKRLETYRDLSLSGGASRTVPSLDLG